MPTYSPAKYPRRPKHSSLFSEIRYQLQLAYYRYELNTGQYVMSPAEKILINAISLSILGLLFITVYYYLPATVHMSLQRLAYYFTGSHKIEMDGANLALNVLQNAGLVAEAGGEATNATVEVVS